jgi:hypothetical protein
MLGRRQRPAQDFIENPLSHPQRQSREAGSYMGALLPKPKCSSGEFYPLVCQSGSFALAG